MQAVETALVHSHEEVARLDGHLQQLSENTYQVEFMVSEEERVTLVEDAPYSDLQHKSHIAIK